MNWFENHLNHLLISRHYFAGHVMAISLEAKNPNKVFNVHSKLSPYQDVGEAGTDHWWEEKRNVSEVSNQTISIQKYIISLSWDLLNPIIFNIPKTLIDPNVFQLSKVLIHPNCDSATMPQYCVLALILTEPFNMQAKGRPR